MTRVLAELLGAGEPMFHRGLSRLEAASGRSSMDIRLTVTVERATNMKLKQLGLDPKDTTGQELYAALQARVKHDDACLVATLRKKYGENPVHISVAKAVDELPIPKNSFALKSSVGKRLLKKTLPKHTMKALGYRSFDSMMRREPLLAVFAAAWVFETATWRKNMLEQYKKLTAADFEIRQLHILAPGSERWQKLSLSIVGARQHNIIGLKEFGAVVLLPLPQDEPPAATLAMLALAMHEMNEVRAAGTFLKLCQVHPNFGDFVQFAVADDPALGVELLEGHLPWQVIQRYYARFAERFKAELFGPHVQKEDLSWHSVEKALGYIEPSLAFWHHTTSAGILDNHQPVSCNIVDAALNFCNQLPYEQRIVRYFRHSLWHELLMTYIQHENIERTVLANVESELVPQQELL